MQALVKPIDYAVLDIAPESLANKEIRFKLYSAMGIALPTAEEYKQSTDKKATMMQYMQMRGAQ